MKDYFEYLDEIPQDVQDTLERYNVMDDDYIQLTALECELKPLGWTFDWGLDAIPHSLRPCIPFEDITPEWLVNKMHEHRLKTKDLAQILSVNIASVSRWRKQEIKPMAQALLFYFFNSLNNH